MRIAHVDTWQPVTEQSILAAIGDEQVSLTRIVLRLGGVFVNKSQIDRQTGESQWTVVEASYYNEVARALQVLQQLGKVEYVRGKGAGWKKAGR